jgi:hypothetical protein
MLRRQRVSGRASFPAVMTMQKCGRLSDRLVDVMPRIARGNMQRVLMLTVLSCGLMAACTGGETPSGSISQCRSGVNHDRRFGDLRLLCGITAVFGRRMRPSRCLICSTTKRHRSKVGFRRSRTLYVNTIVRIARANQSKRSGIPTRWVPEPSDLPPEPQVN